MNYKPESLGEGYCKETFPDPAKPISPMSPVDFDIIHTLVNLLIDENPAIYQDSHFLSIIGSYKDSLSDLTVLAQLQEY